MPMKAGIWRVFENDAEDVAIIHDKYTNSHLTPFRYFDKTDLINIIGPFYIPGLYSILAEQKIEIKYSQKSWVILYANMERDRYVFLNSLNNNDPKFTRKFNL
jgi:hypothetical protein